MNALRLLLATSLAGAVAVGIVSAQSRPAASTGNAPADAQITPLRDGYDRVDTKAYRIEVPRGWTVTRETPWGQRKATPASDAKASAELGMMTGGQTRATWDELYRTSLYFILREDGGKATPYTLGKSAQGYDTASFSVLDDQGFANRRYVLLRDDAGRLLALSIRIPTRAKEAELMKHFDRMVRTAIIKD